MVWLGINIKRILQLSLVLLIAVFLLSGCSGEDDEGHTTKPSEGISNIGAEHKEAACWQAEVLNVLYDSIGLTVISMFNKLTKGAMNVMFTAFAVWLAFRMMRFLSSFAEDNMAEIWNEIIRKAGICLFCGMLASSSTMTLTVVNNLLFPIYNSFLEFGSSIMSDAIKGKEVNQFSVLGTSVNASDVSLSCKASDFVDVTDKFPDSTKDMMKCMICALSQRLVFGMDLSLSAMDESVTGFVVGFFLLASFVVVYLGFVFYMVDSIFKFGVMILMLPLLILSFAFEPTKEWTKKGFSNIMESAVLMMTLCIMLSMAIVAMIVLFRERTDIFGSSSAATLAEISAGAICLLLVSFLISSSVKVSAQVSGALIGSKVSTKTQEKVKAAVSLLGQLLLALISFGFSTKVKAVINKFKFAQKAKNGNNLLKKLAGRK